MWPEIVEHIDYSSAKAALSKFSGLMKMSVFSVFLKKNLEDISHFCGATDTPVLDFW